jgi:hypothetical protein
MVQDEKENNNKGSAETVITLKERLTVSGNVLVRDVRPVDFAEIIAKTISYGMFAACLYNPANEHFSRRKAVEFIPEPYLMLRRLFQYLAGDDLDDRIIWVIDELVNVFRGIDRVALVEDFKKTDSRIDPCKHFYKFFLDQYDPKHQERRGESSKPDPIVAFIAQAVNDCI